MIDSFKKIQLLALASCLLSTIPGLAAPADDIRTANEFHESFKASDQGLAFKDLTYIWYKEGHSAGEDNDVRRKIGWVYPGNSRVLQVKSYGDGREIYRAFYNINKVGLRTLPDSPKKAQHLIVAGDSNTFGVGLNDEQTLPFILSQKYPTYHAYNFGHGGGGPHNTLALFEKKDWHSQIKEAKGKMIYIFYPEWMIERPIGSKNYLAWDRGVSPWYEIENGKLVYKGSLKDKLLTKVLNFIRLIDRFNWVGNLPKFTNEHMKLIAKLLEEIKRQYLREFPEGVFTAVISHYDLKNSKLSDELVLLLKAGGVDVVVINKDPRVDPKLHFPDVHFNYEGQKMIEKELSSAIKF